MTAFDRLGRLSCRAMQPAPNVHGGWHAPLDRLDVRLMVVGDDRARRLACAARRLLEERFGGGGVAVLPQQHVDNLAVLVDGAIQVPFVLAAKEAHFVRVPVATERATVLA